MNRKQKKRNAKQKKNEKAGSKVELNLVGSDPKNRPARSGLPNPLTISFTVISLLLAGVALYWNIAQPDIRYITDIGPETVTMLESKADNNGNFVHNIRIRPTFTNYSFKPGFVDKIEFIPESIATLPEIRITSINKTPIFWHQKKQVEITFLMTVPTDAANNLDTSRELSMDQILAAYDNTGRKIDHLQNGMFGRI